MKLSLIITTYNWPQALEQVLASVLRQSRLPDEVVIADDGSTADTAAVIQDYQATGSFPVIHCWQQDKGFRAAAIRNQAIAASSGDYIVMIDGDMVLHPRFIEDHAHAARDGYFLQGSRVLTDAVRAAKFISGDSTVNFFSAGIMNRLNSVNNRRLSRLGSRVSNRLRGSRTCNFSCWRSDLVAVNGFNEQFIGWGREDSELSARLLNAGCQRLRLRFAATAYHIFHQAANRKSLTKNNQLLENCINGTTTWCDDGLDKHLAANEDLTTGST